MTLEICHAKCPTKTTDLIASLKRTDLGRRESAALNDIKTQMVHEFSDNSKSLFYWHEACTLSEVVTEPEFEELVFAFSTAITSGVADERPVSHDLLKCFARCLRQSKHKIPFQRARLGSVLAGLNSHLAATTRINDLQTIYLLVCTIGTVLDAMVDIKFSDLDRELLHSPLKKTLEGLAGSSSKEPRIAQAAEYAVQALSRVPNNEGPWEEFFRVSGNAIQAAGKISGGAAKLDPSQVLDAGPDLLKILKFFADAAKGGKDIWDTREDLKQVVKAMRDVSERKGWYDALRQTEILIRSKAYTGLKKVLPILRCLDKAPFWCGLYSQLERQWMLVRKGERTEIEQIIHWTLHEKAFSDEWTRHESVRCWIRLVADSLDHPEWKDVLSLKRKHRLPFLNREKNFDPQLKTIPRESHGEESSQDKLLQTALSSCKVALLFYADAIVARYYTNGSLLNIKRLSGDDVPMSQCYVNLSLIEHQSGETTKSNPVVSLQQRLEDEGPKEGKEVSLHELFKLRVLQNKQRGRPSRILIRGRAGVGKTTLCKKITHDFLHNGLWESEYERVIWIPLRRLKDHASLESFLEHEVFRKTTDSGDRLETLRMALNNPQDDRSLFILDGLDEIIGYQRPGGSLVECISDLLNRKHVIITSRPHAVFPTNLNPYDLEIETVGFHDREIASYVENVISSPSQRTEIMNFINRHWAMKGLMRIPIQLDALCFTWSEDISNEKPITTMTGLYSKIEIKLHHKDMVRMGKTVNGHPLNDHAAAQFKTHRQIYKVMKSPIDVLRFMAFFGMYHGVTEFTSEMRGNIHDAVGDTTDVDLDHISFLRGSDASLAHQDREYYFLHLTFQEYFAAQHFVHCWKNGLKIPTLGQKSAKLLEIDPAEFLAREKYNGRYNIMWRFVTGILEAQDNGEGGYLSKFLKQTESEQPDLLGPIHLRFLMHCFSEIDKKEYDHELINIWKTTVSHLLRLFLFCRNDSRVFFDLGMEMEFPEIILLSIFKLESLEYEKAALNTISSRRLLSPNICSVLMHTFQLTADNELRESLARIIGGRHEFSSEFVIDALTGSKPKVTEALLIGLQSRTVRSRTALSSAIVENIFWSAASEDEDVLNARANFLGEQYSLPENILQEMISSLAADSVADRSRAIRSLRNSSLSNHDIVHHVVSGFNEHMGTDTEDRLVLLSIQPTLSPWAIQKITDRLEDMTEFERAYVVGVLESQKDQIFKPHVVN